MTPYTKRIIVSLIVVALMIAGSFGIQAYNDYKSNSRVEPPLDLPGTVMVKYTASTNIPDTFLNPLYISDYLKMNRRGLGKKITFGNFNGIIYNTEIGGAVKDANEIEMIKNSNVRADEPSDYNGENDLYWFKVQLAQPASQDETTSTTATTTLTVEYYVRYSSGASSDPHFEFYILDRKAKKPTFISKGATPTNLLIPGNGYLYTSSHYNETFEAQRKYTIGADNKIVEVTQDELAINLKSKVLEDTQIYVDDTPLPLNKGQIVTIVSYSETQSKNGMTQRYIIALPNGTKGWIDKKDTKDDTQCIYMDDTGAFVSQNTVFENLCFAGD